MRHIARQKSVTRQRRLGAVVLEFIVAMPVLFVAFLAIFEFGILALVVENGTHAVNEGAREGAKVWGSLAGGFDNNPAPNYDPKFLNVNGDDIADQIALSMDAILDVFDLEVRQNNVNDDPAKANALVIIERGALTAYRGNITLLAPPFSCGRTGTPPGVNEIVVTLCFPLVNSSTPATTFGNPVPNWLAPFGFNLKDPFNPLNNQPRNPYRFEMSARSQLE